mmetsp:Transcript_3112/g.7727  ORF Transcript_3112/g.7727 Transcript_3112/m.7727 type:complete len:307 (-) Transcript_3112:1541-2461(-)
MPKSAIFSLPDLVSSRLGVLRSRCNMRAVSWMYRMPLANCSAMLRKSIVSGCRRSTSHRLPPSQNSMMRQNLEGQAAAATIHQEARWLRRVRVQMKTAQRDDKGSKQIWVRELIASWYSDQRFQGLEQLATYAVLNRNQALGSRCIIAPSPSHVAWRREKLHFGGGDGRAQEGHHIGVPHLAEGGNLAPKLVQQALLLIRARSQRLLADNLDRDLGAVPLASVRAPRGAPPDLCLQLDLVQRDVPFLLQHMFQPVVQVLRDGVADGEVVVVLEGALLQQLDGDGALVQVLDRRDLQVLRQLPLHLL